MENFKTAEELFIFLRNSRKSGEKIYRSQYEPENSQYELVPSLFRDHQYNKLLSVVVKNMDILLQYSLLGDYERHRILKQNNIEYYNQLVLRASEHFILRRFVLMANAIGLSIPDCDEILNYDIDYYQIENRTFLTTLTQLDSNYHLSQMLGFDKRINELVSELDTRLPGYYGLAQHHGCPTRLLDFSFSPFKALFHSVNRVFNKNDNGLLKMYILSKTTFEKKGILENYERSRIKDVGKFAMFHSMVVPASTNHYLYQQEGLFVYPVFPYDHFLHFKRYPSVQDFITTMYPDKKDYDSNFQEISLPISECDNVRVLLREENVTLSRLMPTMDNVVIELNELATRP